MGKRKFEARIKELVENLPDLAALVESLLIVRRVLIAADRRPAPPVAGHRPGLCRRLMTIPRGKPGGSAATRRLNKHGEAQVWRKAMERNPWLNPRICAGGIDLGFLS